jgi:hypothetical protein
MFLILFTESQSDENNLPCLHDYPLLEISTSTIILPNDICLVPNTTATALKIPHENVVVPPLMSWQR